MSGQTDGINLSISEYLRFVIFCCPLFRKSSAFAAYFFMDLMVRVFNSAGDSVIFCHWASPFPCRRTVCVSVLLLRVGCMKVAAFHFNVPTNVGMMCVWCFIVAPY